MIDVDDTLREELAKIVPAFRPGSWDEVMAIAGHAPARPVRRWAAVAAFAVTAALVVSVATPLGASIVRGVGNFSSWLTGEPGTPASTKAQQAFNRANARSWIGFPAGTKLRHLTTVTDSADGSKVELLGFRAGSTLCLRIVVTGKTTASTRSCAPLADLRQAGSPVRVIVVDRGFGTGTKRAWYGTVRLHSPALQVTAGIVADGVKKVVVRDRKRPPCAASDRERVPLRRIDPRRWTEVDLDLGADTCGPGQRSVRPRAVRVRRLRDRRRKLRLGRRRSSGTSAAERSAGWTSTSSAGSR